LDAEALRLCQGTSSEILATEAGRKAQIVLNAGAHASLPPRSFTFDQHRLESFRSAVDSGGQAGRPGANDDEVIEGLFSFHAKTDFFCDLERGRLNQRGPIRKDHHGQLIFTGMGRLEERTRFGILLNVEPLVWDLVL